MDSEARICVGEQKRRDCSGNDGTEARELSPTEKQWLVLKNYLQLLEQQSNIQLPMPAVRRCSCRLQDVLPDTCVFQHSCEPYVGCSLKFFQECLNFQARHSV